MGRPPKTEARDTRAQILAAALELFSDHGFHGTSMRDLARAVGVRESALYHHFANKEELFAALVVERGQGEAAEVAHALDVDLLARDGAQQYLRALLHRVLERWAEPAQQRFARLMLSEGSRPRSKRGSQPELALGGGSALFAELFAELTRRGVIRPVDPELLLQQWLGPILMLRLRFFLGTDRPDLKKAKALADRHVAFFFAAVRP